ncbi:hypothetical protein [Mucilaginibacter polytrichastri]|uniref:Uncharacterized protein n=1 Tax=Mucilaginibacter polytrichastri TaxID=1302689 RepID=A0A1Q5ZXF5_9SPHI|nr:hypothetical protein [Mucilaginibacter polytrichastri]OKS86431.1 hypothetical protein RG47T_1887 [Mucilaginibacter polytrichastri]SFS77892.1 hypothetical protein SAMN04487890_1048 [Mucilaginibacter polytrichastri]
MIEKNKLIRYLIIGFLFFTTAGVFYIVSEIKEINYQFKGTIVKINYNEKRTPTVLVNGKLYYLSTNWRFNENMSIGDSLVKEKKSMAYKLIKHKTGEVILSQ